MKTYITIENLANWNAAHNGATRQLVSFEKGALYSQYTITKYDDGRIVAMRADGSVVLNLDNEMDMLLINIMKGL